MRRKARLGDGAGVGDCLVSTARGIPASAGQFKHSEIETITEGGLWAGEGYDYACVRADVMGSVLSLGSGVMLEKKKKQSREKEAGTVTVREMELEDIPTVYALGEKVFPADKWPNLYRTWDEYELVDLFASDGETCLVADLDDKVVGFALGTIIEKRRSAWTYGYLLWIGVDPDIGPRGAGGRLFTRMQEIFIESGARMMLVDTAAENAQAIAFFRKQGFDQEQGHIFLNKNLDEEKEEMGRRRARRKHKLALLAPVSRKAAVDDESDD